MDDRLERILEEGVSDYAKSEPLAGMEERILARIRIAERPRRGVGWRALVAVGLVGIVAVVVLVVPRQEEPRPVRVAVAKVQTAAVIAEPVAVRVIHASRHHMRSKALPMLRVFPTPTPLTAEERRLIALVRQDPQGAAETFESLRKRNEPIEIAPLVIEPLEGGGGQ